MKNSALRYSLPFTIYTCSKNNLFLHFQDRINEIRRMIVKEKSVRTTVVQTTLQPSPQEPEQSTSSIAPEQGTIN